MPKKVMYQIYPVFRRATIASRSENSEPIAFPTWWDLPAKLGFANSSLVLGIRGRNRQFELGFANSTQELAIQAWIQKFETGKANSRLELANSMQELPIQA
jgi:hypothetical protein